MIDGYISNQELVSRLYQLGRKCLGSYTAFIQWCKLPNTCLGGVKPLRAMQTEQGMIDVYALLLRIEYGVYS